MKQRQACHLHAEFGISRRTETCRTESHKKTMHPVRMYEMRTRRTYVAGTLSLVRCRFLGILSGYSHLGKHLHWPRRQGSARSSHNRQDLRRSRPDQPGTEGYAVLPRHVDRRLPMPMRSKSGSISTLWTSLKIACKRLPSDRMHLPMDSKVGSFFFQSKNRPFHQQCNLIYLSNP
ncbi:hypothetical protein SAMN04515618_11761 [Collimonas sp. OK307]|nr:hypothetical protein SAMN04515618_11761 [Collimonas sp. OK307]